jgi:hypothetical protein
MIPYRDLSYINEKLSLMIWVNLIAIFGLIISMLAIVHFKLYALWILIVLIACVQMGVSYHIHLKLRKHVRKY